ncbi:MAG: hypothetical protein WBX11_03855 [Thiobacillaceae bacterium]
MRTQFALVGLCLAVATVPALAGDQWKTMPVLDTAYKPDLTVSALVGSMDPEHVSSSSFIGGELAFNCLLLQPPTGIIRTKVSIGGFSHGGLKLTTYEINPRWMFNIDQNLSVGFGPGLGYVDAKAGGNTKGLWAGQIGADLDYRIGAINLGLAARWQGTQNNTIATGFKGADNTLVEAKIGYNF